LNKNPHLWMDTIQTHSNFCTEKICSLREVYLGPISKIRLEFNRKQVEFCEIPRIGGVKRLKSGVPLKAG
jgi:hypothetical protein